MSLLLQKYFLVSVLCLCFCKYSFIWTKLGVKNSEKNEERNLSMIFVVVCRLWLYYTGFFFHFNVYLILLLSYLMYWNCCRFLWLLLLHFSHVCFVQLPLSLIETLYALLFLFVYFGCYLHTFSFHSFIYWEIGQFLSISSATANCILCVIFLERKWLSLSE